MTDLVRQPPGALVPAADRVIPEAARAAVAAAARGAWAGNTQRAYAGGWKRFSDWCESVGRQALPAAPETVILYLTERGAKEGLSTLAQTMAAIGARHGLAGYDPPPTAAKTVKVIWKGVRRQKGMRARGAKAPLTLDDLRMVLNRVDRATPVGKRDAAILLFGFWSAERRSEIMGAHVEHVTPADEGGLAVLIPKSKGDQEGAGQTIGLARRDDAPDLCPVRALATWREAAGITAGPIFRRVFANRDGATYTITVGEKALHPQEVARLVKRYCAAAGMDPKRFAGHSLRRGHVTEAIRQGVPDRNIADQTRHKSTDMLRRYNGEANPVARGSTGKMKTR